MHAYALRVLTPLQVTALAWHPTDDNYILFGLDDGSLGPGPRIWRVEPPIAIRHPTLRDRTAS